MAENPPDHPNIIGSDELMKNGIACLWISAVDIQEFIVSLERKYLIKLSKVMFRESSSELTSDFLHIFRSFKLEKLHHSVV
ncbi:hypothetical protein WICPIJ_003382 [Wickerhamomyces pijperi]|uniref:Uncharacterized protein n=1 Tax=Wickerhamomyces pijperi TaxID=599730 RepID=A0A9P8Q9P0_WICPI|nr:hypothetical protein WICPIJ_003382 [Wickerhamomyces pijperi]